MEIKDPDFERKLKNAHKIQFPPVQSVNLEDHPKIEGYDFEQGLDVHPLVLLEGGTEVIFKVGDLSSAGDIFIHAVLVEVYPDAR